MVPAELPEGRKALGTNFLYKLKAGGRYKARLVVRGNLQQQGYDYTEVWAPASKHSSLRAFLSVAAASNMHLHQLDVKTAFLNADLEEEIYVTLPPEVEGGGAGIVYRLRKAIYGLKQAPRAWYKRLREEMELLGFRVSEADPALFIRDNKAGRQIILCHVDDLLIGAVDLDQIKQIKAGISRSLKISDMGPANYYLAMEIEREGSALLLTQKKCTREMGLEFGGGSGLVGYADSDYANNPDNRRSTTGYAFLLNGGAISWASKLQPTVAASTTEAEYMAAAAAVKEALWLRKVLPDLGVQLSTVSIKGDNTAALKLLTNPIASDRSKHIDVMHHFARERALSGEVCFSYIPTQLMVADSLTKALVPVKFLACREGLGVRDWSKKR
jgi:hypothetical protein